MPKVSVESRLHRTMKGVKQLERDVSREKIQELGVAPLLANGENILGIYWNRTPGNFFVVTDLALIFRVDGVLTRLEFVRMKSSLIIAVEKTTAEEVRIELKGGKSVSLIVDGGDGQFRDVFSMGRFVMRVIEDHTPMDLHGETLH